MMRGEFDCELMSTSPVVPFGLLSLGGLNALKKATVKRSFTRSVISKYLKRDISWFQLRGPRKKFFAFQVKLSPMDVETIVPLLSRCCTRLSKAAPTGWMARWERSTGTRACNFAMSALVAVRGLKS